MKRIFYLTLLVLGCSLVQLTEVQATNWLYLFGREEHCSFYLDTDSYIYDEATKLCSCWYKFESEEEGLTYQALATFDLKKKRSSIKGMRVYRGEKLIQQNLTPEAGYTRIDLRTNEGYIFSVLNIACQATEKNIPWEFNTQTIPPASPLDSPNWIGGDNSLQLYLDESSKYKTDQEKAGWIRMGNTVQWYRFDLVRNRAAIYAQKVYQEGRLISDLIYPIILWTDEGTKYSSQAQRLFLKQSVICFRMKEGVQLVG